MQISELKELPKPARDALINDGIITLNPPQELAVNAGLLKGKSIVVSAPTAGGKTLIAELAFLDAILNRKKKAVYIVPLKALGSEKYKEFKKRYEPLGISVAVSMGGRDSREERLAKYDIIIATSEKMDSLLRHRIDWIGEVGLVIADEIHILGDMGRGPTLEVVISRMRMLTDFQILALSATISNADELAGWLKAELVKSDYRPVKLSRGIYSENKIEFEDDVVNIPPGTDDVSAIANYIVSKGNQALVFVSSRPSAEATAEKIAKAIEKKVGNNEKLADKVEGALEHSTRQCRRLAQCIKGGAAFHHAGLVYKQREEVEEGFKKGKIKVIAATPTLAAGVNLPSTYVIIRDNRRFQAGYGMRPLPVLEIEQMCGRAGRPKYDTEGYAVMIAKNGLEAESLYRTYFQGKPEKIFSQLALEPALRMHILSIVATGDAGSDEDVANFLEKTFYAYQFSDMHKMQQLVRRMLGTLAKYGLVEINEEGDISTQSLYQPADSYKNVVNVKATEFGRRVAELYLDPETAHLFAQGIDNLSRTHPHISFLHLAAYAQEMRPLLRVKPKDYENIFSDIEKIEPFLVVPKEYLYDEEELLSSVKSAMLLEAWASEEDEESIMEKFGTTPGELRVRLTNADWLVYSLQELSIILSKSEVHRSLELLRSRLKYGVKAELLDLVRIRGIGRVKARKLFGLGVNGLRDIRKVSYVALAGAIGSKTAKRLKEKVGQPIENEVLGNVVGS
ncbi:MAG: DEAD/DEAH box helicase [Candidatus Aenigmarchaeota archaeon]|nr:DEAD/DEAH box helicase [Candidatus Aenigmarchaeota archaeon]